MKCEWSFICLKFYYLIIVACIENARWIWEWLNTFNACRSAWNKTQLTAYNLDQKRTKRRKNSVYDLGVIAHEYNEVLKAYRKTLSIIEACRVTNLCRRRFYTNRYITELKIVNNSAFETLYKKHVVESDLNSLAIFNNICRDRLREADCLQTVSSLRMNGKLIP